MRVGTLKSLAALFLAAPLAHAGLVVGEPRQLAPPLFVPAQTHSDVVLTANDGTFLATWQDHRAAVRLDRDGDALDLPPLALGLAPWPVPGRSGEAAPEGPGWLLASRGYPNVTDSSVVVERIAADGAHAIVGQLTIPRSFGPFDLEGADGSYAALYGIIGAVTTGVTTFDSSARKAGEVVLYGVAVALAHGNGRFAALLHDRVILLRPDASVERSIQLPPLMAPRAIASVGETFAVAGVRDTSIVVVRIEGDRAVEVASIDAGDVRDLALAGSGDEILIVFAAKPPGDARPYQDISGPIFSARIGLRGVVEGPVALGGTSQGLDVEGDQTGWLVGWSSGGPEENRFSRTRRIEADEPLVSPADDVDPIVWNYHSAKGVSIATHGDVALVVWAGNGLHGALFDARGARLSDLPIPEGFVGTVARREGFLIWGTRAGGAGPEIVAYAISPGGVLDPEPIVIGDASSTTSIRIECAGDLCLAAWVAHPLEGRPGSIRIARIAGRTVLDAGGVPLAVPERVPYEIALASDGARFLVAWPRHPGPGTIVSAALVAGRDGLQISTFDAMATIEYRTEVLAAWNGAEYEIVNARGSSETYNWGSDHRIVRVTADGRVIEGEESGWSGWPIEAEGALSTMFTACGRSYLTTLHAVMEPVTRLYQLERRRSALVAAAPFMLRDVACFDERTCLGVMDTLLTQPPSVSGILAWVVPLTCARERLVGR